MPKVPPGSAPELLTILVIKHELDVVLEMVWCLLSHDFTNLLSKESVVVISIETGIILQTVLLVKDSL